jgi:hypothetical protein
MGQKGLLETIGLPIVDRVSSIVVPFVELSTRGHLIAATEPYP